MDISETPVSRLVTTAPMSLCRTTVTPPTSPGPTDLIGTPVGPDLPTPASADLTGTLVSPPTTTAPSGLSGTPVVDLISCESVMYEMREDVRTRCYVYKRWPYRLDSSTEE